MKSINNLLYSKTLGDYSSHVFIDGECVKSRSRSEDKPTIDEALSTGQTVLIQKDRKIKIYSESERLSFFEKLINHDSYLRQAAHEGNIIVVKNSLKVTS